MKLLVDRVEHLLARTQKECMYGAISDDFYGWYAHELCQVKERLSEIPFRRHIKDQVSEILILNRQELLGQKRRISFFERLQIKPKFVSRTS